MSNNRVEVHVGAKTSELKKGMNEAESIVKDTAQEIEVTGKKVDFQIDVSGVQKTFDNLSTNISTQMLGLGKKIAAGIGSALAADGLVSFTRNAISTASEVQKMSDMLGESVEDFQYFAKGAQTAGLSLEQFGMMGKDALDRLGEARRGEGEMMDFFEKVAPKIGVTIDMFKDLSGPEVIQAYYDGLEKANLSHAEIITYMEQIVDDGSLLIPLLKDGGAGFKKWGEEAKNAGAIMSKDMVNNLGKAKENLYTLELQFQGFQAMLINSVTPAVTAIAQNFDNIKAVVIALGAAISAKLVVQCAVLTKEFVIGVARNWVLNNVDVLNEIIELKKFKNKAQTVTALKQISVKAPESLIQIYLTEIPTLPSEKGTLVSGKGEFHFDGQSFTCYVQMEVQGASSAAYAKKNWNIAFFSDPALTKPLTIKIGDLLPHDELVYKANWIDHTNIRNAMCYRLWEQFCSTRTGYPRLEVETPLIGKKGKDALQNGANGVPRLYSALLYINDEFYGLGSFGTAKKRGNYNIAKNKPKEILIGMDGWNNITNLEVTNPTLYELKAPSSPTIETFNAISGWNAFTQLNDADFALQANTYLNKQNAIDFMIFAEFVKCRDVVSVNFVKNLQFISYDGKRFMFMPYDMDTVIGLEWTGEVVYDDTTGSQTMDNSQTSFWRKVKKTYNSEIEARYKQLRDLKIISVDNIYNLSTDLLLKYPISLYDLELNRWPARPSLNITSLEQILTWTKKRIQFLDTFFNYTA
ncbi:CotH kinase family protein [Acinetobacter baumannii]|uniref:CotH kinase family protein n=1 Tax=Acinetobacter baumannii TaxID=470 RepID=UPI0022265E29|nr:CotH kinase family protein [Acinetobacter baumannii]MCW3180845.1 CotH kinase family protein [Acinetobacter baumannii]